MIFQLQFLINNAVQVYAVIIQAKVLKKSYNIVRACDRNVNEICELRFYLLVNHLF